MMLICRKTERNASSGSDYTTGRMRRYLSILPVFSGLVSKDAHAGMRHLLSTAVELHPARLLCSGAYPHRQSVLTPLF